MLGFEDVSYVYNLNHDEVLVLRVVGFSKNLHVTCLSLQLLTAVVLNGLHYKLNIENHLRKLLYLYFK